jgi:hypothetical protein
MLREEGRSSIVSFSRPLVSGRCVFKDGDKMRHNLSVRPSDPAANRNRPQVAAAAPVQYEPVELLPDDFRATRAPSRSATPASSPTGP